MEIGEESFIFARLISRKQKNKACWSHHRRIKSQEVFIMIKKRIICAALILTISLGATGCASSNTTEMVDGKADDAPAAVNTMGITDGAMAEDAAEGDFSFDYAADTVAETAKSGDAEAAPGKATIDESTEIELPEAGQLTAGEWSDNENWGFFTNLVSSGTIAFPSFGIDPTNRTMVTVKGTDGAVIPNAKANLLDKSANVIWSGVTDKNGIVYLFTQTGKEAASVEIECGGKKQIYAVESQKTNEQDGKKTSGTEMEAVFGGKGQLYKATDIMFILDTTGSMSDEMMFLQSEFTEITKRIGTDNTRYSVNFYRDEGDDYVTKCSGFSTDTKKIQKELNKESAAGGGDFPEAVAEVLTETIFSEDWNEESVKLAFLIFDAPPHDGKEKELVAATEEAAKKGIRLISVVASDNDRDTELFGRALAITTGGTYVFLTDDSGIGNSHEEPIIGSYEVRPLLDTIIDIINEYRQ